MQHWLPGAASGLAAAASGPAAACCRARPACKSKLGALLQAACEIGCICGEKAEKRGAAREYGRALGLAFQLQDDLLDLESTTEELGKPVGSDEKNGKATFVSLFGAEACRELVKKKTGEAVAILRKEFRDPDFLIWLTESLVDRKN